MVQVQSSVVSAVRSQSTDLCAEHFLLRSRGDYKKATERVYHSGGHASYVELPVVGEQ